MASSIALGLLFVVNVGLVIWLIFEMVRKQELHDDDSRIINFASHDAHGRFMGVPTEIVKGAGSRYRISYRPEDADAKKLLEKKQKLLPETIIVDSNKLISLPKGTVSKDKNILIALADNPEEMDEAVKRSPLGVALSFLGLQQDFVKKQLEIHQDKIKNRDDLLKEVGDAEMSTELITK